MIFIRLDFPTGRWHATAWGSHVNEGVPEWPPCPWRLCRALLAAWFWKHRQDEAILRSLIEKLARNLPEYQLPEATAAHTRHFMPVIEGKKETKTKVFDTFIHVSSGKSLWIRWDVDLDADEKALLATLLGRLNYIGRAESLVVAELEDQPSAEARSAEWTTPVEKTRIDGEPIRILAPQAPSAYVEWMLTQAVAPGKKGKGRSAALPEALFGALQLDTADWKDQGWNIPPGARWVEYVRPRDCLKIAPVHSRPPRHSLPTVARYAIKSKVPPAITQSLSLAERFHQALCSALENEGHSKALTGRNADGTPAVSHGHVYFLPECDHHGYVTHMTLHAPGGFEDEACDALGRLRRVWGSEGFDIDIVLLATGHAADFENASPYFKKSRSWVSLTPFVPVRHAKANRAGNAKIDPETGLQIGSPEQDCWRLLKTVAAEMTPAWEMPIAQVAMTKESCGTRIRYGLRSIPCLNFQRTRRTGEGTRAGNRGYSLRIDFSKEVALPIGLGYAAHFGLGLFVPVEVRDLAGDGAHCGSA